MSYWSGGYQKKPSEYVVDLHKLSAHLILKNYGEVHMITDSNSIDSFKDLIKILKEKNYYLLDLQKF